MQGISSKAAGGVENKKKYNGIELENDLELQTYDAFFRELDPQIGRWWQLDPVTEGYEHFSPYASMYNNPLTYSDPLGNEGQACCWEEIKTGLRTIFLGSTPVDRAVREYAIAKAEATGKQMGKNFQRRWETKTDLFHQLIMSEPGERLSLAGPIGIIEGEVQMGVKQEAQILKNAAQGAAFEKEVLQQIEKTQVRVVEQVTVKTESGVKTRIDLIGKDKATNQPILTEAKSSPTAPLTKNQKKAFPEIEQSGATVVGQGKPGYPAGTKIPPTKVDIVRPKKKE